MFSACAVDVGLTSLHLRVLHCAMRNGVQKSVIDGKAFTAASGFTRSLLLVLYFIAQMN